MWVFSDENKHVHVFRDKLETTQGSKKITSGNDPPTPNMAGGSVVRNAMPLGLLLFLLAEILIFSTFFSLLHSVIIYQNREP